MADVAVNELIHYNKVCTEMSCGTSPCFYSSSVSAKKLCMGDFKNSLSFNIITFVDLFGLKLCLTI